MLKLSKIPKVLIWIISLAIALMSFRFMALGLEEAFPGMSGHIKDRNLAFLLHVSASPVALALGLFQFLPGLRARRPGLHRWTGRIYVLAVFVGGLAGFVVAMGSFDRPVAAVGFGGLAVFWLGTTARAIYLAMTGQIEAHQRWMIRSYALTLAAVTLRLALPLFIIVGEMEYAEASIYIAWQCWVPNLIIAEWYLRTWFVRKPSGEATLLNNSEAPQQG
jgi:uncharacterized membrane protein